jgi:hypothetical protein
MLLPYQPKPTRLAHLFLPLFPYQVTLAQQARQNRTPGTLGTGVYS